MIAVAVMAIQCGLVAAGALGILMLIIIARSRLFTGEPLVVPVYRRQPAYYEHDNDRSKMLISYDRWQWLTQLLMH